MHAEGGHGEKKLCKLYYDLVVLKGNPHAEPWQTLDGPGP